ncbi:MAG: hypothetical protein J6D23_01720, partial [Clostridia bacterium]|nr:hypothetical protein [Clostridia bacterium]
VNITYGVFAVSQEKIGDSDVFDENGNAISSAITAELTDYAFSIFEVKVVCFADDQKALPLAIGAYVKTTDGDKAEYSYLQSGTPEENEKYCFVSYNDIVK